ncbi:hypothetical protein D3C71_1206730 [compost metagenome]
MQALHRGNKMRNDRGAVHHTGNFFQIDIDAVQPEGVDRLGGGAHEIVFIALRVERHRAQLAAEGQHHDLALRALGGDVGDQLRAVQRAVRIERHLALAHVVGERQHDHIPAVVHLAHRQQALAVVEVVQVADQRVLGQRMAVARFHAHLRRGGGISLTAKGGNECQRKRQQGDRLHRNPGACKNPDSRHTDRRKSHQKQLVMKPVPF